MAKNVLFLCTGNSCRSQMAEGWARQLLEGVVHPHSAGVAPQGLDPKAVQVMQEAGVDISGQASKTLEDLPALEFDAVITLCDQAKESCPFFPGGATRLHRGFEDPATLARDAADEASALQPYRRVRDEIREFVRQLPETLA
ncbi:MAG: arsenate reductase ArsC [Desulfohalobiaceae bacterium]